jgi:hypothetical protein
MKKTAIRQVIDLLGQKQKHLKELNESGVLLSGEFVHKSNEISSIQILLSRFLEMERQQIIDAHKDNAVMYEMDATALAEHYYTQTFTEHKND